ATYMTMVNEIDLYRNRAPHYTADQIQKTRQGGDPWLYPNTDWFGAVIKPLSLQNVGHVSLRGSADRIGYYMSLGRQSEDGYYRNSGTHYNQYNFRSNIDGRVSDHLSLRFDVTGRFEDRNFPIRSAGAIFRELMRGKPNFPAYWPNGLPGPDIEYGDNPAVIATPATGYTKDNRYYLIAEYHRERGRHTIGILAGAERQKEDSSSLTGFRDYFVSNQVDELFAGGDLGKTSSGTAWVAARQNYFTRINYAFQDKYLVELVGRYDGSYIFPVNKRFGFFPAVSVGWRITEEPFFRNRVALF